MQSLQRSLDDHDLGHLRIVAELWGIDLPQRSAPPAARPPPAAAEALAHLLAHGGRSPLADVARVFGPLTQMGPGRRDREKPWQRPQAAVVALYFRGLLALSVGDTP